MNPQIVNEYNCYPCNRDVKIILTGHNNEQIHCPHCGSDDIYWMKSHVISEENERLKEQIHYLKVLRNSTNYEERRNAEKNLLRLSQR